MEEKVKKIISQYTKIPVEEITPQTVIDRTAVASSILLHRMYGNMANEGIAVENYWDIQTYGALLQRINGKEPVNHFAVEAENTDSFFTPNVDEPSIGIDIEKIESFPIVNDFREDEFYTMNFTSAEIAYCILQVNPIVSFAGLFAAKEAIVKADNSFKNKPFNSIFIDHLPSGKPIHHQFQLSISHTEDTVVAVAIKSLNNISQILPQAKNTNFTKSTGIWLSIIAIMLSLVVFLLMILK